MQSENMFLNFFVSGSFRKYVWVFFGIQSFVHFSKVSSWKKLIVYLLPRLWMFLAFPNCRVSSRTCGRQTPPSIGNLSNPWPTSHSRVSRRTRESCCRLSSTAAPQTRWWSAVRLLWRTLSRDSNSLTSSLPPGRLWRNPSSPRTRDICRRRRINTDEKVKVVAAIWGGGEN